jgi:hypothetical protein
MKKQMGFTLVELFIVIAVFVGVGGWIANIIKLIGILDGSVTAMFVARCVGIFVAPFGSILGFF